MTKNALIELDFQVEQYATLLFNLNTYFIVSEDESALVDPVFTPSLYDDLLQETQTTLKYILITHHPHEFVNDEDDLAKRTGATIIYGERSSKHATKSKTQLQLGSVKIEVLSTPGFTDDSACFLVINSKDKPKALFTGATLTYGDIGHSFITPDTTDETKTKIATELSESLTLLAGLDSSCVVFPGYSAGGVCGGKPSAEVKSTLAKEMENNSYLKATHEERITKIKETFQQRKPQFDVVAKSKVKEGTTRSDVVANIKKLSPSELQALIDEDKDNNCYIFDTRDQPESAVGYIPSSIILSLKVAYTTYMLGTIDVNANVVFVTASGKEMDSIVPAMQVGYSNVIGYLEGGFAAWKDAGKAVETIVYEPSTKEHVEELLKEKRFIIDIREFAEFREVGIVKDSVLTPLSNFNKYINEGAIDKEKDIYVLCKSGARACIAITYLKKLKYANKMIDLQGGCMKLQETKYDFAKYGA